MKKTLALLPFLLLPALLLAEDHTTAVHSNGNAGHGNGKSSSGRSNGNGRSGPSNYRGNPSYRPSSHYYNGGSRYGGTGSYSSGSHTSVYGGTGRYSGGSGGYSSARIGYNRQVLPKSLRHSSPGMPGRGPAGNSLASRAVSPKRMSSSLVRNAMSRFAANDAFSHRVNTFNATESLAGHYYWHNYNGLDFCHYCDRWGCNWYGWYLGGAFFWTQFYWGNWWWLNPLDGYWCYWYGGNWCWQEPGTQTVYIYQNGNYTPEDETGGVAQGPDNGPAQGSGSSDYYPNGYDGGNNGAQADGGEAPPEAQRPQSLPSPDKPIVFKSPDGSVIVHLEGASRDAFLYQTVGDSDSKPVYLGSGVSQVLYSKKGGELQILLIMDDGSFAVFNANGDPVEAKPAPGSVKPQGYES